MGDEQTREGDVSPPTPTVPSDVDIRQATLPIVEPFPIGPALAIDVTEILRRGFKSLTDDEKAIIIAGYLSNQKSQLSIFDTPDEVREKTTKLEMDQSNNKTKNTIAVVGLIVAAVGFFSLIGVMIYTVAKQGVLSDSTLFQGVLTMVQEVFKVISSGGKF